MSLFCRVERGESSVRQVVVVAAAAVVVVRWKGVATHLAPDTEHGLVDRDQLVRLPQRDVVQHYKHKEGRVRV
jgi:hypothetical protein